MPACKHLGRPRKTNLREVANALLYIASLGGTGRLLQRIFHRFPRYRNTFIGGGMKRQSAINNTLVMAARELADKQRSPTAGVIDSQSVKTTESGGIRDFDAGKKITSSEAWIYIASIRFLTRRIARA